MPIAPGERLGHYQIQSVLGSGGMGIVYRALDTKLNRPAAIKVLSTEIADAAARRRFQREAQTASSLNHPHIVTVYDAGEIDGQQYLITEFVDGGTLKDWAAREQPTWKQAVDILTGVADGLAAAHQAGILHRDIKPANILVAKNGYAKLADFGLAKLEEAPSDETRTLTEARTKAGHIVGTIAYMSPEQASGKELDARSDIFSFGIVLYELLARRRPFQGRTDLELLKTIIHGTHEPLGPSIPANLVNIVDKALEKYPAERYHSMRDLTVDLKRLSRPKPFEPTAFPPPSKIRSAAIYSLLWVLLGVASNPSAGLWSVPILDHTATEQDVKAVQLPTVRALAPRQSAGTLFYLSSRGTGDGLWRFKGDQSVEIWKGSDGALLEPAAISPDGLRAAVALRGKGKVRLHVMTVDGNEVKPMAESVDLRGAASWSADGQWIVTGGVDPAGKPGIFKIPIDGGAPTLIVPGPATNPMSSPDGRLIVYTGPNVGALAPLLAVHPDGSKVDFPAIQVLREGQRCRFFPDGKALVFMQGVGAQDFWKLDFATMKTTQLTRLASNSVMRSFDITPDGKQIIFDRLRENSDIVLIDLPRAH